MKVLSTLRSGRWPTVAFVIAAVLIVVMFGLRLPQSASPEEWQQHGDYLVRNITAPTNDAFQRTIRLAVVLLTIGMVGVSALLRARGWPILGVLWMLWWPTTLWAAIGPSGADADVAPVDELKDRLTYRGREFVLLAQEGFRGDHYIIARLLSRSKSREIYQPLTLEGTKYAHIVIRAASLTYPIERLFVARDSYIVALGEPPELEGAFDLTGSSQTKSGDMVSPFILLGPRDKPNDADVRELLSDYKSYHGFDVPDQNQIRGELKNPNPYVREICRKLLSSERVP